MQGNPSPEDMVVEFFRKEWFTMERKVGPLAQKMAELEDWIKGDNKYNEQEEKKSSNHTGCVANGNTQEKKIILLGLDADLRRLTPDRFPIAVIHGARMGRHTSDSTNSNHNRFNLRAKCENPKYQGRTFD